DCTHTRRPLRQETSSTVDRSNPQIKSLEQTGDEESPRKQRRKTLQKQMKSNLERTWILRKRHGARQERPCVAVWRSDVETSTAPTGSTGWHCRGRRRGREIGAEIVAAWGPWRVGFK